MTCGAKAIRGAKPCQSGADRIGILSHNGGRSRRGYLLLLLGGWVLLGSAGAGGEPGRAKGGGAQSLAALHRGMTAAEVRQRLGEPPHIARQLLYHRYIEQWVYPSPLSARLEFDCRRGRPPLLTEITSGE